MIFGIPWTFNSYLAIAPIVIFVYYTNPGRSVYIISLLPENVQANPFVFWAYFVYEFIITLNSIGFILIGSFSAAIALFSTKLWISKLK